ncbi:MAG TPA: MaoC/PaaZ C-terminal domain-containing protein [Patescibacteria group bacterium]|nr:MaoC/PaaZ C-terminal domain-containing protein [Patescibacteria group bacterium]
MGQRARRTQTVTAREVELYAQITGDRNPLHFDEAFAKGTRFGRLVAQGGIAAGMLNPRSRSSRSSPTSRYVSCARRS